MYIKKNLGRMTFRPDLLLLGLALSVSVVLTGCDETTPEWEVEDMTPAVTEYITAVAADSQGNCVMVGEGMPDGVSGHDDRLRVTKVSSSGSILWSYQSTEVIVDAAGIAIDDADDIFIAGSGDAAIWVMKMNPDGDILWRQAGLAINPHIGDICLNGDGETVIVSEGYTHALDKESGTLLWSAGGELSTSDLTVDLEGNSYVAGIEYAASYDSDGNERWSRNWNYRFGAVKIAYYDNNLYAIGARQGWPTLHVTRLNGEDGSLVGQVTQTLENRWGASIAVDHQGNVITAVSQDDNSVGRFVTKYTPSLSQIWSRVYRSGITFMDLDQLMTGPEGRIYITGGRLTTCIDPSGNVLMDAPSGGAYASNAIALSRDNTALFIGTVKEYSDDQNFLLIKYPTN